MQLNFLTVYTKADGVTRVQEQTPNVTLAEAVALVNSLAADKTIALISFGANVIPQGRPAAAAAPGKTTGEGTTFTGLPVNKKKK
jgi:hypothetical protein